MLWTLYLDLDAFYVSCERRERPQLDGRPVIVGPNPREGPTRGVVLSASYEARSTGVRSAMPVARADRLCPEATWVPPDFAKYERASLEVRRFVTERYPRNVALSIDEVAILVELEDPESARRAATELQSGIREALHLPCSIGVAGSRTVGKIASDRAKPGGIVVVPPEGAADFLAPLPVRSIPGVGPKTEATLKELGVERIGELRSLPPAARRRLGRFGEELVRLARGEEPTEPESEDGGPRSRSADATFPTDLADPAELHRALDRLASALAESLESEGLRYRSVRVSVRWADFRQSQRSRTMPGVQEGPDALGPPAHRLLEELLRRESEGDGRPVRSISIGVARLVARTDRQSRLERFAPPGAPTVM